MKKQRLGRTELMVYPVTYGGLMHKDDNPKAVQAFVDEAISHGVNYFDIAPDYGNAESLMGPVIEKYRDDVIIACKTKERSAEGAKRDLLKSLELLRTDHFDVYQFHAVNSMDDVHEIFGPGGAVETFLWARDEGLINYIGMSIHNEEAGMAALERFDFDLFLWPLNWALSLTSDWGKQIEQAAKEGDRGLLAMKVLAHRHWREHEEVTSENSWVRPIDISNDAGLGIAAMKYAIAQGGHTLVPPAEIEHFRFMLKHIDQVMENPLTEEELEFLKREAELVKDEVIFDPNERA